MGIPSSIFAVLLILGSGCALANAPSAPRRIAAIRGMSYEEARVLVHGGKPTPDEVAKCKALFESARSGKVPVTLADAPAPREMSLWEVVETDSRWMILGDLWSRAH